MIEIKELINVIIQDLGEDKSIKGILLKSQIVASKLNNEELKTWIENEQNGYKDAENLPAYRILNATVKGDISIPYRGLVTNYTIPGGIYDDPIIEDCMSKVRIIHSLSEIETIYNNKKNGNISTNLPAMAYDEVNKHISGNVLTLKQEFPVSSLIQIVNTFKSKLLSFFLELDKEIGFGIDFSKIEGQNKLNQIMNNYYINSVVANTGSGSVQTGDIQDNTSVQMITEQEQKDKLLDLVSQLIDKTKDINNKDLKESIQIISDECKKPTWNKKILRMAFNAIKGIATGIAANQLTPVVTSALALL